MLKLLFKGFSSRIMDRHPFLPWMHLAAHRDHPPTPNHRQETWETWTWAAPDPLKSRTMRPGVGSHPQDSWHPSSENCLKANEGWRYPTRTSKFFAQKQRPGWNPGRRFAERVLANRCRASHPEAGHLDNAQCL